MGRAGFEPATSAQVRRRRRVADGRAAVEDRLEPLRQRADRLLETRVEQIEVAAGPQLGADGEPRFVAVYAEDDAQARIALLDELGLVDPPAEVDEAEVRVLHLRDADLVHQGTHDEAGLQVARRPNAAARLDSGTGDACGDDGDGGLERQVGSKADLQARPCPELRDELLLRQNVDRARPPGVIVFRDEVGLDLDLVEPASLASPERRETRSSRSARAAPARRP
jgi:hypothetical protein